MTWFAVVTKPNAELRAAAELKERDFAVWLPLALVERRHARRRMALEVALFQGYCFLDLQDGQGLADALAAPGVVNVVRTMFGLPLPIAEREIARVQRMVAEAGGVIDLRPRTISEHLADRRPIRVKLAGPTADPKVCDEVSRRLWLKAHRVA